LMSNGQNGSAVNHADRRGPGSGTLTSSWLKAKAKSLKPSLSDAARSVSIIRGQGIRDRGSGAWGSGFGVREAPAVAATKNCECGKRSGASGSRATPLGGVRGPPPSKRGAAASESLRLARRAMSRSAVSGGGVPANAERGEPREHQEMPFGTARAISWSASAPGAGGRR
jgi:hypothetical protein